MASPSDVGPKPARPPPKPVKPLPGALPASLGVPAPAAGDVSPKRGATTPPETAPKPAALAPANSGITPPGQAAGQKVQRIASIKVSSGQLNEMLDENFRREDALLRALQQTLAGIGGLQKTVVDLRAELHAKDVELNARVADLGATQTRLRSATEYSSAMEKRMEAASASQSDQTKLLETENSDLRQQLEAALADAAAAKRSLAERELDNQTLRESLATAKEDIKRAETIAAAARKEADRAKAEAVTARAEAALAAAEAAMNPTPTMTRQTSGAAAPRAAATPPAKQAKPAAPTNTNAFDFSDLEALESELTSYMSDGAGAGSAVVASARAAHHELVNLKLQLHSCVMSISDSADAEALRLGLREIGETGRLFSAKLGPIGVEQDYEAKIVAVVRAGVSAIQNPSPVQSAQLRRESDALTAHTELCLNAWVAAHSQ